MKRAIGMLTMVLIGSVVLVACGRSAPTGDAGPGPARGQHTLFVIAVGNTFGPRDIRAVAGEELVVNVRNFSNKAHEFTIKALDISTGTIGKGDIAHARLVVPSGVVAFQCRYHSGMRGQITGVEPTRRDGPRRA